MGFHPMTNEATTAITKENMMQVIALSKHEPKVLNFADMAPPVTDAPQKKQKPEKQPKQ